MKKVMLAVAAALWLSSQAPAAAQFAQAVEIAEHRHVRVGGVLLVGFPAFILVNGLSGTQQGESAAKQDNFQAASLGGNANIQPGGRLARWFGDGEK